MMETYLATSIEPIEVAFVRSGLNAALDVAAVKAVENGTLALEGRLLRVAGSAPDAEPLTGALIAAVAEMHAPNWFDARSGARPYAQAARRALEHRLVAAGLLREPTPWRWLTGRRTPRGKAWLAAAQLAYPAAQIAATDPALALALHGPRSLDGTRYHPATVARTDGGGCGAMFADGGGGGGHGGCGHGGAGCGGAGGCGGGGCGGA